MDLFILIIWSLLIVVSLLPWHSWQKEPEEKKEKKEQPNNSQISVIEIDHYTREEFYDAIRELCILNDAVFELANDLNLVTEDVQVNYIYAERLCLEILEAERIKEQSHIEFSLFYHEKIKVIHDGFMYMHNQLMIIKTKDMMFNSILGSSYF